MNTQTIEQQAHAKMQSIRSLVDELVTLEDELAPMAEKIKRAEEVKRELKEHLQGFPEEEGVTLKGHYGEVQFSKCRIEKVITDKKRLVKLLSRRVFDDIANFKINDLRRSLTDEQIDSVVTRYYGPRSVVKVTHIERTVH